jgi:hypothetical protein
LRIDGFHQIKVGAGAARRIEVLLRTFSAGHERGDRTQRMPFAA